MDPTSGPPPSRVILVVDDEPAVRRVACQALEREGYGTVEAGDGREALALLEAGHPAIALVLSDIRMPDLDGIELELTVRERWPDLPVVLMSGEVTRDWVARLVREQPLHLIRKPFRSEDLLQLVRALLDPGEAGSRGRVHG